MAYTKPACFLLSVLTLMLLFASCRASPAEFPPASGSTGSSPESEADPSSAGDRMKKLVRDEAKDLKAQLESEKAVDPIFDETKEPDPADKAELYELRKKRRQLGYDLDEIDGEKDPDGWDALARKIEELDLRIEELELRTLPSGYSKTREDARKDYASYAYFRKPGHPFSHFQSMSHRVLCFDSIEMVVSGAYPYLPDLAPAQDSQTAFTASGIDLVPDGNSFTVIMEVTDVFWGDLSVGDLIAFRVDGEDNARYVRDSEGWLLFTCNDGSSVLYHDENLPLFHAFSYMGYEILKDGTLLSCTRLGEFERLDGLTPEAACRLVLRTFLKYGDLRGKNSKLAIDA